MAKSVLDIIIRTIKEGGADKETVKGLVAVKQSIQQAAAVGASLVAAGYAIKRAFDATVGTMVAYAEQVRDVQRATQLSAEEASKLIQFTDDMGVSYETLSKAIKSAADSTDFSIEGLAKASDQYLKITDANERAAYAQKLYGKAWVDMVGVLEKGGGAIRSAANEINGSLVLTQKAVDQARQYEIAVDNLSDAWQGFTVSIGSAALPVVNDLLLAVTKITQETDTWAEALALWADPGRQVTALVGGMISAHKELDVTTSRQTSNSLAMVKAFEAQGEAIKPVNAALKETVVNYSDLLRMTQSISDAEKTYAESVAEVTADTSLSVDERKAKLDEITAKYSEATNKIILDSMLQKMAIDGLTQAEFDKAIAFQTATGMISKTAADQASAFNEITTAAAEGKITVEQMQAAINALQDKSVTLTITQIIQNIRLGDVAESVKAGNTRPDQVFGGGLAGSGRAKGTKGWETVPAGYPNDSYPIMLTSGEKFAVIPPSGSNPTLTGGGMGGGDTYINLTIASPMTILDEQTARKTLLPFIVDGVREAQARGTLR